MKKLWFFLAMFVCVLASCSDGGSDEPSTPTPKPEEVKTEITIDSGIVSNGLSFASSQGEQSVSFSVNANWTLSVASTTSGATWCKASVTSGSKGSANVKFTVNENTSYDDRSVSVTIKAGTVSKTFTITQKGAEAMLVTTSKYEVAQEGGKIEVEVKANVDYQFAISETAKDWITETKSKSRGLTTYKHSFDIAMNEEAEKREGEITFKSGDKVETVKVYQAGGAIILLTQNEYTVSDAGETITVDIKSNVEYGVQMPDVDWITDEASSRGMSSHTLKYVIAPNEDYDSRSADIVFYDKNSDLKDTLKVVQVQKDAIIVAKNEYKIESVGGDLKFEVNTNVDFEVSTSVDWIKQNTESRALETKPLSFIIAENTSLENDREGLITISAGELKQEIKVIQQRKIFFNFSTTEVYIESDEDAFAIEVSTNGGYGVIMPQVDWLTQGEISKVSTNTYINTFIVSNNETYDSREAEIKFHNVWTDEYVVVKVIQAQKDAIIISQKTFEAKSEGETIEVKISTNVDFEVGMPDVDWISQTGSRSLKEHTLCFKVAENIDNATRSAKILFTKKDSEFKDSIIVNQLAKQKSVTLTEAGTLKELLGNDYLKIASLKIVGPINGDDVYCLRKMLGGSNFSEANWGKLTIVDLSETTIVEGGESYFQGSSKQYYTSKDVFGEYMFQECTNLRGIKLPKTLKIIDAYAFYNCNALNSIDIPDNVTSIEIAAFEGCKSLISATIGDGVTTIRENAFYNCTALTSVTIGTGVKLIDRGAFINCDALTSVFMKDLSAWCNINFVDSNNPLTYNKELYLNNKIVKELVIPENVTEIKKGVFNNCKSLVKVTMGAGVTSIGEGAFSGCDALTSFMIGTSVTSIGFGAFSGCDALTSIEIPENLTSIGRYAFSYCDGLTSINIPNSVTLIDEYAFYECGGLTSVTIGDGNTNIYNNAFQNCDALKSLTIGDGVFSIGDNAFSGCDALVSVTIGNGCTYIGYESFHDCSSLKKVKLGDGITKIDESAFLSCSALASVVIGRNISKIGSFAFSLCGNITEFYCYATTPPDITKEIETLRYYYAFGSTYGDQTILYVPERCGPKYKSSKWGEFFKNIVEMN